MRKVFLMFYDVLAYRLLSPPSGVDISLRTMGDSAIGHGNVEAVEGALGVQFSWSDA
jgi:hypothetical protein